MMAKDERSLLEKLRAAQDIPKDFTWEQIAVLCRSAADEIEFLRSVAGAVSRSTDLINKVRRERPDLTRDAG